MREEVLEFISRFSGRRGYSPSIRDIQKGLGISSTSVVNYWLRKLHREGKVTWEPGKSRTLRVTSGAAKMRKAGLETPDLPPHPLPPPLSTIGKVVT